MRRRFALILLVGAELAAIGFAAQQPLDQVALLEMARSGTPTEQIVNSIRQNGIDFKPEKGFLNVLRMAGAEKPVIEAVQTARRVTSKSPQPSGTTDIEKPHPKPLNTTSKANLPAGVSISGPDISVISAPRPVYMPKPAYTPEAKSAKLEGRVVLGIVIGAHGNVTSITETSGPLGKGLDESAIETVRTWKFEPAKREGVPVAVRVLVEVSFRLK